MKTYYYDTSGKILHRHDGPPQVPPPGTASYTYTKKNWQQERTILDNPVPWIDSPPVSKDIGELTLENGRPAKLVLHVDTDRVELRTESGGGDQVLASLNMVHALDRAVLETIKQAIL
tara:strand:+ start:4706 stop:5059 length:354 start_codon:yes stop_codon:yes gene_type:complete